jgi:hypothetical protein
MQKPTSVKSITTSKKGGLISTLKGSFMSLAELTEYTEKDNYHFSFAAEAPQMKTAMPGKVLAVKTCAQG